MKASALEFRLRFLIIVTIFVLGFSTPWNYWLHLDTIRTWQFLAAWPARSGWLSFSSATSHVLLFGILCAFIGASLRTWGSAYLNPSVVQSGSMHGEGVVAAGPYRFVRNPLYLGTFFHAIALALLMLPSGAIFTLLALTLFELRLITSEESFLTAKLGEPYLAYCAKVPRILPALSPRVVRASNTHPTWPTAFLSEIYMWGVVVTFAIFGWRYNSILIIKGVLISLGISLIARAFLPSPKPQ